VKPPNGQPETAHTNLQQAHRMGTVPARSVNWRISPFEHEPYTPLPLKEKAYLFALRTVQPSSLGKSLVTAGIAQWRDSPEQWGQGMAGFSRRYAHRLVTRGVENAIGFGVAAAFRQDPRYYRLGEGGIWRRTAHAASYTFVTKNDQGNRTFSIWRVSGNYGSQFVSNTWRPDNDTAGDALIRGSISLGYDAASNIFKEFWPDIRRIVFKR
jgi:hypothetical protein